MIQSNPPIFIIRNHIHRGCQAPRSCSKLNDFVWFFHRSIGALRTEASEAVVLVGYFTLQAAISAVFFPRPFAVPRWRWYKNVIRAVVISSEAVIHELIISYSVLTASADADDDVV